MSTESSPKHRIERAAADLLARDGYNGMGMKSISDGAGLPYGSIYHHFPGGKEEIAGAAITAMGAYTNGLLAAAFAGGVDQRSLRAMFGFMASRLERSDWAKGCTIGSPALDGSADSEVVRAACESTFSALLETIAAALVRQGVRPSEAEDLATTILACYEGATMLARAQRSRAPLDAAAQAMARLVTASVAGAD
ncbi:MAG: putative HTH-type transcriptional regulator YxaF [Ilumatobacteraceae bacterium]|nr:putative HTH-type transcriptional regulator YxaF [Ilumatobacteraceae bacterium]